MSTLILYDAAGHERHRAKFPSRVRAEAAARVVERDLRDGRTTVRVVGVEITDPLYTVSNVARVMVVIDDVAAAPADVAFDARARACGDDP